MSATTVHACPHLNTTNTMYTHYLKKKEIMGEGMAFNQAGYFIFFISLTCFRVLNNHTPLSEYVLKGTNSMHFY